MEEKLEELRLHKVKSGTIKFLIRWIDLGSDTASRDRYGFLVSTTAGEIVESNYDTSRPPETYQRNVAGKLGIPFAHKTPFWQVFGLQCMSIPPAPYGDLDYKRLKQLSPVPVVVNQINLDIPRTFPHHPSFSTPEMQLALKNILNAYAVKNPALGYCQSLNFIGAALLLTMRESDAFLMLCFIVEHLFPEYWTHSMLGVQVDLLVLDYYLKKKLPNLANHFSNIGIDVCLMATGWIMSIFLTLVPFNSALRLWDFIFTKGPASIIIISYSIIKYFSEDLMKMEELSEVSNYIQDSLKSLYQWQKLVDVINSSDAPKKKEIDILRKDAKVKLSESIKKRAIAELKKTKFELKELEDMYQTFMSLPSASVNASLSIDEFFLFIKKWPIGRLSETDAEYKKALVDYFDTNKDGSISFKEYCIGMSSLIKGNPEDKIQFAFKIYDTNNNGTIEKQEMVSYLASQYRVFNEEAYYSMATYHSENIFKEYDVDNNGVLSYEEFKNACERETLLMRLLQSTE